MADNKSRQPLLLFYQKDLYLVATATLKKRASQRPHKEKLMNDGAETFSVEDEASGIPSCVFLINRDPSYIHNLLVSEDETLRPAYLVSVSAGPKPTSVDRDGVLIPHHCVRSVGRPELSKRFLLCEDLYFDMKLVSLLKSEFPETDLYSDRNGLFSTQFEKVEPVSLDWLYTKSHLVSYDQISAELLRVSRTLSLPMATIHFTGTADYIKSKVASFCENVKLSKELQ
jgi:hypothetical protein